MTHEHEELDAQPKGSLSRDGSRKFVHPADVKGRFTSRRNVIFAVLIVILVAIPFIRMGGHPVLFLDVEHRQFFLFGRTFNAQDFWLSFFILSGIGFALIVVTTAWGRVWCGYSCPQTVFLEGIYRRIERAIEGPRERRIRRNAGRWSFDKVWRKALKHLLFVCVSLFLSHVFSSYFVSLPALEHMVARSPAEHAEAFGWVMVMSALLYLNFAWFREQLCLIVCPYGRLQSVLTDDDSLVIGYDPDRGEPRGKAKDPKAGDCVNCQRCVKVCPTGIDIRNGLQIECIGCAACVDACDDIMLKLKRKPGLIRYDSLEGLEHRPRRFWRPRLGVYAVLGLVGLVAATLAFRSHTNFEANLLRPRGAPFAITEGDVRNTFDLHLVNKYPEAVTYRLEGIRGDALTYVFPVPEVTLDSLVGRHIPVMVSIPESELQPRLRAHVRVVPVGHEEDSVIIDDPFVGPLR